MKRRLWLPGMVLFAVAAALAPLLAQPDPNLPPIWTGIFSSTQAERGKTVVSARCAGCHGQNNPLSGDSFMLHWEGHDVAALYRKIKETMPPGAQVTSVTDADKLDIVAFVLQQNGYPGGDAELPADEQRLSSVRFVPRSGVPRMRTGSVVQILGCLSQGGGTSFRLTSASEPEATSLDTRDATSANPADGPLGSGTIDLLDSFPSPAPHLGKKVMVKGFLIKNAAGDRLNVVSLVPADVACQ
jgi:mono/diheme cytochrome c family protein